MPRQKEHAIRDLKEALEDLKKWDQKPVKDSGPPVTFVGVDSANFEAARQEHTRAVIQVLRAGLLHELPDDLRWGVMDWVQTRRLLGHDEELRKTRLTREELDKISDALARRALDDFPFAPPDGVPPLSSRTKSQRAYSPDDLEMCTEIERLIPECKTREAVRRALECEGKIKSMTRQSFHELLTRLQLQHLFDAQEAD